MSPPANQVFQVGIVCALLGAPVGAARLEVRAVNPFNGEVYRQAQVRVLSSEGREVCRGGEGVAACDLPAGTYRLRARQPGFGAPEVLVSMAGVPVYREVALRIEAPVDRGPIGAFTPRSEGRLVRIERNSPASNEGYELRIAAVHDAFEDALRASGSEFHVGSLRPGLYQITISSGLVSKGLLAIVHDECKVLSVPWEEMPREIDCH